VVSGSIQSWFQGFVRRKKEINLVRIALSKEFKLKKQDRSALDFPNENLKI
jgi:hypothetical protein